MVIDMETKIQDIARGIKKEFKALLQREPNRVTIYCQKRSFMVTFVVTKWGKAANIGPYSLTIQSPFIGAEHLVRNKIKNLTVVAQDIIAFINNKDMYQYRPLVVD